MRLIKFVKGKILFMFVNQYGDGLNAGANYALEIAYSGESQV